MGECRQKIVKIKSVNGLEMDNVFPAFSEVWKVLACAVKSGNILLFSCLNGSMESGETGK